MTFILGAHKRQDVQQCQPFDQLSLRECSADYFRGECASPSQANSKEHLSARFLKLNILKYVHLLDV